MGRERISPPDPASSDYSRLALIKTPFGDAAETPAAGGSIDRVLSLDSRN
jgi:hypothetical protein